MLNAIASRVRYSLHVQDNLRRVVIIDCLQSRPQHPSGNAEDEKVVDVVLSSGFLSFANHAGFLKAVEEVSRS
jgi:hypothetical protein